MADPVGTIVLGFPHPLLPPLCSGSDGPTYASILAAHKLLNANAQAVASMGGDGRLGHLALTMSPTDYMALSVANVPFVAPVQPPPQVLYPVGATAAVRSDLKDLHEKAEKTFTLFNNVDKALRNQLLAATPSVFLDALSDPQVRLGNTTCLELLDYLYAEFGTISPAELDANLERMKTSWSPPTPIHALFRQLADGAAFAKAGHSIVADEYLTRIGYNIIFQNGQFDNACRDWRALSAAPKTFALFKKHFTAANTDVRLIATTRSAGLHGMANLAELEAALSATKAELAASQLALAAARAIPQANAVTPVPPAVPLPAPNALRPGYCWTHGTTRSNNHTSRNCNHKADGHMDDATAHNKLGGSTRRFQRWTRHAPA